LVESTVAASIKKAQTTVEHDYNECITCDESKSSDMGDDQQIGEEGISRPASLPLPVFQVRYLNISIMHAEINKYTYACTF